MLFSDFPVPVQVADGDGPPSTPIKSGSPLSIRIISVFPGDENYRRGKMALLTSAVRSPIVSGAMPLAMHYLYDGVEYGSLLNSRADQPGSDVIYYSPAELSNDLDVTVRLAFDKFNEQTLNSWIDAAATAAALPVFAVSGPGGAAWVAVAKGAAKLVTRTIDSAVDGDNDRVMTWRVNLNTPEQPVTNSGFVLLYPDGNELVPANVSDGGFEKDGKPQFIVKNGKLHWRSHPDKIVLEGDSYVLVYINGAEISGLAGWAAAAVSANLTNKFLNANRLGADDALEAFKLFNDVRWLKEVKDIESDIRELTAGTITPEIQKQLDELDSRRIAARKNIQDRTVRSV